jgi:D-galactarolactone cycloisomerase
MSISTERNPELDDRTRSPRLSDRIARVQVHHLRGQLREPFGWSLNWTNERRATLVEVTTREGLTGWGDGACPTELLREQPDLVLGRSPFEVEGIFESLREPSTLQRRRGESICGGLDMALWDLQGQILNRPVCEILGRVHRRRVRPYCTALYRKNWPDLHAGLAEEAQHFVRRGFRTIKMKIGFGQEEDVAAVQAVRTAVGDGVGLAVDSNCAYDASAAMSLSRRLEQFDLRWWEEPLLANDYVGYERLHQATRIPLASGETLGVDQIVRDYVQPRVVDIVQPEVELVGLTGARRISQAAWLNHVRVIPHNWSTAIRTAAILHWMATVAPLTEALRASEETFELDCTEHPFRDQVVASPPQPGEDGMLPVPDGPGLGIAVLPHVISEFRTQLITVS